MDLAKRDTPLRSRPQTTFRRETTMPRQATDLPGLEVNAQIHRADMSGAEELSRILNLGTKVATNIAGDIQQNADNADSAAATLDFATGQKNDERFSKSHAYRDAWQLQGAKKLAVDVSTEVTDKFNAALNDPDHPATIQDLDHLFEETVKAHLVDERGKPLNFITPQATATLGTALMKLKMELMPKAAEAIKAQTDDKLLNTTFHNMLFERTAGAPIGAPSVAPAVDASKPYYPEDNALRSKPIPKGWKGNQEDAIQELGMTAEEAKKFIKTGKDPRTAAASAPMPLDRVSLKARIASAESGGSGDGAVNLLSTASGRYGITNGTFTANGGSLKKKNDPAEQERVMDSLLAKNEAALTKAGVPLTPGTVYLAHFLGSTGAIQALANPSAAVSAKVQKSNPFTRGWKNSDVIAWADRKMGGTGAITDGSGPELATAPAQPALRPGFNVEEFMSSLPPSVDKGAAKVWLINSLIAQATSTGDTSLLNGLETSARKDGAPSFNPEERIKIAEVRDRLEEHNRVEHDRAERQLQEDNSKSVLQAIVEGKPPSRSWLAEQSRKGLLDENFVYSLTNHMDEQAQQDAREARAEVRQAQAEVDADADATVYAMAAERRAGILTGSSYAEDVARYKSGELGTGKKAAARLLQLQAATKAGQAMTEQNPEFAYYSAQLAVNYKPQRKTGQLILNPVAKVSKADYAAMVSFYEEKVHSGEKPGDAYREATQKYAPKAAKNANSELADVRAQIAALRAKKLGQ